MSLPLGWPGPFWAVLSSHIRAREESLRVNPACSAVQASPQLPLDHVPVNMTTKNSPQLSFVCQSPVRSVTQATILSPPPPYVSVCAQCVYVQAWMHGPQRQREPLGVLLHLATGPRRLSSAHTTVSMWTKDQYINNTYHKCGQLLGLGQVTVTLSGGIVVIAFND